VSQTCELCDRPLSDGYIGTVCAICKQDYRDRSQPASKDTQPASLPPAPAPTPPTANVYNPTAPVQQVHIHHAAPPQAYAVPTAYAASGKSKVAFILLGIFLGQLGIHNFYAGYTNKGLIQLLLSLLLCWTFIVPTIIWIWAIVEVCTIGVDAQGAPFT
jgi:TM2 domain-containing membrane protein YozV